MRNQDMNPFSDKMTPVLSALLFLVVAMIAFILIGPLIGIMAVMISFDGNLMDLAQKQPNAASIVTVPQASLINKVSVKRCSHLGAQKTSCY